MQDRRVALLTQLCRTIESHGTPLSLAELADAGRTSESRVQRLFKSILGVTPKQYVDAVQSVRVRASLQEDTCVTTAMFAAGYSSSSRFYEKCHWILGMKPRSYGDKGKGELILHATVTSPLGLMNVAATATGVCSIAFGDDQQELKAELQRRFENATLLEGDEHFHSYVATVAGTIDTSESFIQMPLDIRGTAFMRRVWSALTEIGRGETRTYSQVAESLGAPNSARAVAGAIAKNKLAVVIPCHRVVRTDGGLGGYRWGLERKERLLESEEGMARKGAKKQRKNR